jgi:hypothetical protein
VIPLAALADVAQVPGIWWLWLRYLIPELRKDLLLP